jgi:hypothetical protein
VPSIIDTLNQEVMWYAQDGLPTPLESMDPGHMANLYHYLLRNADRLYQHKIWKEIRDSGSAEEVLAAYTQQQLPPGPEAWIRSTPFFLALYRRMRNHGSINPDSLAIEGGPNGQGREEQGGEEREARQVFYLGAGQSGA